MWESSRRIPCTPIAKMSCLSLVTKGAAAAANSGGLVLILLASLLFALP